MFSCSLIRFSAVVAVGFQLGWECYFIWLVFNQSLCCDLGTSYVLWLFQSNFGTCSMPGPSRQSLILMTRTWFGVALLSGFLRMPETVQATPPRCNSIGLEWSLSNCQLWKKPHSLGQRCQHDPKCGPVAAWVVRPYQSATALLLYRCLVI